jgi:hypothetical protein
MFSARAVATTGCGSDGVGDIGPITVSAGTSYAYNYQNCFSPLGDTTGWNHTISTAPLHGTLTIVGSTVTYTAASGYVGTDFWEISAPTIENDGAEFGVCGCNLTGTFNVVAPPPATAVGTPTLGEWAFITLGLLVGTIGYFALRRQWQGRT